jgi:hypothetical protein
VRIAEILTFGHEPEDVPPFGLKLTRLLLKLRPQVSCGLPRPESKLSLGAIGIVIGRDKGTLPPFAPSAGTPGLG